MMIRLWTLPFCVLAIATSTAQAAPADDLLPEALLPAESVGYLRFDGIASHRQAYEKTILAETIREEFQPLIDAVTKLILDAIGPQVLSDRLLAGARPSELIKLQKAVRQLPTVVTMLKEHGFALGVEVIDPQKPRFQVTIVFSGGGEKNASAVLGAFRLFAHVNNEKLTEAKVEGRTILQFTADEPVKFQCWKEGPHVVLTIGTEDPKRTIALANAKRKSLAGTKLFQKMVGFRSYETWARGFFNVAETLKVVEKAIPPAKGIVRVLGIDGMKDVTFHLGFEGKLQRSTVFLSTPGERKGLLKLIAPKSDFSIKKLPFLPPDVVTVSAAGTDFSLAYDEILKSAKLIAAIFDPMAQKDFEKVLAEFEKSVGVSLKKDIVDSLGSTVVTYSSVSEGPLSFGTTVAIEVKDAARLQKALDTMIRSLSSLAGVDVGLQKRKYRGATLNMLKFNERGFPFVPTYTIHNGWLVVSVLPQPVQGFIFRSTGKPATWKPPALLARARQASLKTRGADSGAKAPRLLGISVDDPRPGVKQVLSVAPLLFSFIRNFGGDIGDFDISLVPNSQAVAERLSENVTVAVDDGNGVRIEGYASIPFPTGLTGLDTYGYLIFFSFARLAQ